GLLFRIEAALFAVACGSALHAGSVQDGVDGVHAQTPRAVSPTAKLRRAQAAAGAIVQCAAPSKMSYTVIYNQISQVLQFPVDADRSVSFGKIAFAAELDSNRNVTGYRLYLDLDGPNAGFITSNTGRV